jgi:hypothetical protein
MELAAELANRPTGEKVRLGYAARRMADGDGCIVGTLAFDPDSESPQGGSDTVNAQPKGREDQWQTTICI